jgi:hypothetical protein
MDYHRQLRLGDKFWGYFGMCREPVILPFNVACFTKIGRVLEFNFLLVISFLFRNPDYVIKLPSNQALSCAFSVERVRNSSFHSLREMFTRRFSVAVSVKG